MTVEPGSESGTDFSESGPEDRPRRKVDALAGMRRDRNGPSFAQVAQIGRVGATPKSS